MNLLTNRLTVDFEKQGMAIASVWSTLSIFSDTILAMLKAPTEVVDDLLDLDDDFFRAHGGVTDFAKDSVVGGAKLSKWQWSNCFPYLIDIDILFLRYIRRRSR